MAILHSPGTDIKNIWRISLSIRTQHFGEFLSQTFQMWRGMLQFSVHSAKGPSIDPQIAFDWWAIDGTNGSGSRFDAVGNRFAQ